MENETTPAQLTAVHVHHAARHLLQRATQVSASALRLRGKQTQSKHRRKKRGPASSDDGRVNLIQLDANDTHMSKFEIGIEIGSLEDDLTHKIERDGMTKIHGF